MPTFNDAELSYLAERRLARLATIGPDGTPQVNPVGMWRVVAENGTVEVGGRDFAATQKFRNVSRIGRAAIVVDDMASTDPWRPRGVEIRGTAAAVGDSQPRIVITPTRIRSWGLGG